MTPFDDSLFPKFNKEIEALRAWAHSQLWVYDIETYPNFFSLAIVNAKTLQCYYFELSPWYNNIDELSKFLYYLSDEQAEMVGFNNQGFDWPVVDYIFRKIPAGVTNLEIYSKVEDIFNTDWDDRNKHVIWHNKQFVKQIDLFKLNHYDNKGVSLKQLENNMGMDNIEELPVKPGSYLTLEQRPTMYKYNWHDVAATLLFLSYNIGNVNLRRTLKTLYDKDFTNSSESSFGSAIIKLELEKAKVNTSLKTHRDVINFNECVFPCVNFERPEFVELKNWIMQTSITKTKEALNDIDVPYSLAKYMNPDMVTIPNIPPALRQDLGLRAKEICTLSKIPAGESLSGFVFIAKRLHVVVDGFQFDLGTGGLHGSISSAIVKTNSTHELIDVDVGGYYPSLAEAFSVYPEHLGIGFCKVTRIIFTIRAKYPKSTHKLENTAFKLANNASYGNSNSPHSFLYDPKYTMIITLNGQLLLCMLAEQLLKVPGLSIVQANTDGITYHCPHAYVGHTKRLCEWWEGFTRLTLEQVSYEAMYIRDVNNYIAIKKGGDRKMIGAYKHDLVGEWHKNFDERIVAMAAEAALCDGANVGDFIQSYFNKDEHRELFCLSSKVGSKDVCLFVQDGKERVVQRITRYYAAYQGGKLVKVMKPLATQLKAWAEGVHYEHEGTKHYVCKKVGVKPPSGKYKIVPEHLRQKMPDRRISIEAKCLLQPCNNIDDFNWDNCDIEHYIDEANKLVLPLQ